MKLLLAMGALLAMLLAASAFAGPHSRTPVTAVSSSRLVKSGHIRITVRIKTPVFAGHGLKVTWHVRNISKQPRKIHLAFDNLWLVIRSPDGTTYDTRIAFGGFGHPFIPPVRLRPGQTVSRAGPTLRVRWSGPLRITPGWYNAPLPTLRVAVKAPGAPSPRRAVAQVVANTGHLLDHCRPTAPGVAVTGRIDAPKHSAPPLRTRCSVRLHHKRGFDVAQVLVFSPRHYRGVHLRSPYEQFTWPRPGGNAEAIGWEFVVTRDGVTSVDSTTVETAKAARGGAPDWQWTTSGWTGHQGGSHCGHTGGGGGGYIGPLVEFVSACR